MPPLPPPDTLTCKRHADDSILPPPIKISWLKKYEGDDFLHVTRATQEELPFNWTAPEVGV